MKTVLLAVTLTLTILFPAASQGQALDSVKDQIVPKNVAERPPEVSYGQEFERDTFTKENFYNKSAGTRQYRRNIYAPTKSMNFQVVNPLEQNEEERGPTPNTQVIEKDGKAVTVISIGEGDETEK